MFELSLLKHIRSFESEAEQKSWVAVGFAQGEKLLSKN